MAGWAAKILSFIGLIFHIFGIFLISSLRGSPSGGLGFLALVAILAIISLGAIVIGNIFSMIAIVVSRNERDLFTGACLILTGLIYFFPLYNGFVEAMAYGFDFPGFIVFLIVLLLFIGYVRAGLNRMKSKYGDDFIQ